MIKVAIPGCGGQMGRALIQTIANDPEFQLCGASETETSPYIGRDAGTLAGVQPLGITIGSDAKAMVSQADGVIDFTTPTLTVNLVTLCVARKIPLVVGTTGLHEEERRILDQGAKRIPLVFAPNMSIGVNVLFRLCELTSDLLGPNYDLEIIEAHHRKKIDAPSGTALCLAEILAKRTQQSGNLELRARHGRHGKVGPRNSREIGIHAIRTGDTVGEHTVIFGAEGERLELTHRASSRQTFVHGALRALKWAIGKPSGLYDMQDVLGLR